MPNTESVIERIAVELIRRLLRIKVENGYPFNVVNVFRQDRLGRNENPEHQSIVVIQGDSVRLRDLDCPGNPPAIGYETQFDFSCIVRESDHIESEVSSTCNEFAAAVQKAIVTPETGNSTWYTLGGHAVMCDWGNLSPYYDGATTGVVVSLLVHHKQSETDPYESR